VTKDYSERNNIYTFKERLTEYIKVFKGFYLKPVNVPSLLIVNVCFLLDLSST